MQVTIIDTSSEFEKKVNFSYVVIISKYMGKFLFVRHKNRITLEIPGGKIEHGETAYEAAHRELAEETGATIFSLKKVFYYEVSTPLKTDYGMVFVSNVTQKSADLKFEISELYELNEFPNNSTYPTIQQKIFSHYLLNNA